MMEFIGEYVNFNTDNKLDQAVSAFLTLDSWAPDFKNPSVSPYRILIENYTTAAKATFGDIGGQQFIDEYASSKQFAQDVGIPTTDLYVNLIAKYAGGMNQRQAETKLVDNLAAAHKAYADKLILQAQV